MKIWRVETDKDNNSNYKSSSDDFKNSTTDSKVNNDETKSDSELEGKTDELSDESNDKSLNNSDSYEIKSDSELEYKNNENYDNVRDDIFDELLEHQVTDGYNILNKEDSFDDKILKIALDKFINQRFTSSSNLNSGSYSFNKKNGYIQWDKKKIVKHLVSYQYSKLKNDKYSYDYEFDGSKNIPLSFYFDLSGSMVNYTSLLSIIALKLLEKNIKVLIGFNEKVHLRFNSVKNVDVLEFKKFLDSAFVRNGNNDERFDIEMINTNIDEYLISNKAEKCVIFSDFDAIDQIFNAAKKLEVYWLILFKNKIHYNLSEFKGFYYQIVDSKDLIDCFLTINKYRFETLKHIASEEKVRIKK